MSYSVHFIRTIIPFQEVQPTSTCSTGLSRFASMMIIIEHCTEYEYVSIS